MVSDVMAALGVILIPLSFYLKVEFEEYWQALVAVVLGIFCLAYGLTMAARNEKRATERLNKEYEIGNNRFMHIIQLLEDILKELKRDKAKKKRRNRKNDDKLKS